MTETLGKWWATCMVVAQVWLTVPMLLTLLRAVCILPLMRSIWYGHWNWAIGIFVVAVITDLLDGFFARYLKQESQLGLYLDPLVDKLLLIASYGMLIYAHGLLAEIPVWLAVIMILREVLILVGACVVLLTNDSQPALGLQPSYAGKLTMVAHSILLGMVYGVHARLWEKSPTLLFVAAAVTACLMTISLIHYLWRWRQFLQRNGIYFLSCACLGAQLLGAGAEPFVVKKVGSVSQRQQLREAIAEQLLIYADLLVEELDTAGKALVCGLAAEVSFWNFDERVKELASAARFLESGIYSGEKRGDVIAADLLVGNFVQAIAEAQKKVLCTIKGLFERDQSCFPVRVRAKIQLERYLVQIRELCEATREQVECLKIGMKTADTASKI